MYNLDDQLVSELVHCIEEEGRSWGHLYEIARARDKLKGFCIPETHWGEWLSRIEVLVHCARVASGRTISDTDRATWAQMLSALPASVADEDIDEVVYTIRVRARLESFWHRHAPCRQPEYEIE